MLRIFAATQAFKPSSKKDNKNNKITTKYSLTKAALAISISLFSASSLPAIAAKKVTEISLHYLRLVPEARPVLSNILPPPEDLGEAGAELAIADSNTTGRFLGQHYTLNSQRFDEADALLKAAESVIQKDAVVLVDVPTALMAQLDKQAKEKGALLFNIANPDDVLRSSQCLNNTFHTYPSRSMLTDALAQWLAGRRFSQWFLIAGPTEGDQAYLAALKRSAKRFGGRIVDEKSWSFDTDLRRTAQKELPLFTQAEEYDVVLVADEEGDFGHYVPYNTWLPRPVAGTQGLTPVAWHRVVEQWGAAQLQSRFIRQQERNMQSEDYAAWAAVR
ncbi:ABC transporter substrate-binding protein, partial [Oceanospirillum sp. HFRX-1_2]